MNHEESKELWDRLDNEPERAYRAFRAFLCLPAGRRSVLEAYRSHVANPLASKVSDTFGGWSRQFAWYERAAAYDEHLERLRGKAVEETVEEEAKRHAQLVERSRYEVMEELTGLHDGVMQYLESLDWSAPNVRLQDIINVVRLKLEASAKFAGQVSERNEGPEWTEDEREFVEGVMEEILAEQDDDVPDEGEEDPEDGSDGYEERREG